MDVNRGIDRSQHSRWTVCVLLCAAAALIAGCAQTPKLTVERQIERTTVEDDTGASEQPVAVAVPTPPRSPTAYERNEAQALAKKAVELLNAGDEGTAKREIEKALNLDPENKLAASLMRQITDDPFEMLGLEHFNYRVQRDESLSILAERYLKDVYLFYALSRYNDIKVPRMLNAGQEIKIPGKRPAVSANAGGATAKTKRSNAKADTARAGQTPELRPVVTTVSPGENAYQQGMKLLSSDKDKAYDLFSLALGQDGQHQHARVQADKVRPELIDEHKRLAMTAFHRQDMVAAVRHWDRVLQLDPRDDSAKAYRAQALRLKGRIDSGNYTEAK